jgi:hypothetical protein
VTGKLRFAILAGQGALVAVLSAAPAASFQPARTEPDLKGYRKLGEVYWRPALFLRNSGYEDNVFLSPEGQEVSDVTATLAPELEILAPVRDRAALKLREQLSWTTFADHQEQNFLSNNIAARGELFLRNWSFHANASHLSTRERPADEIDLRPRREQRRLLLGTRFEHRERLALDLEASRQDTEYSDDSPDPDFTFRERLNRTEDAAHLTLAIRVGRRTDLVVEAERRLVEFENLGALATEARERRLLGGVDWAPRDTLKVKVRAGNLRLSPEGGVDQSFDGLAGLASVQVRLFSRLNATLEGDRDLFISSFTNNLFAIQNRGALRLSTPLTRRFGAEAGVELFRVQYSNRDQASERRDDSGTRHYVGTQCRISDKLSAGLRLSRFERDSSLETQDRSLTTLTTTVGYFF